MDEPACWIAAYPDIVTACQAIGLVEESIDDAKARVLRESTTVNLVSVPDRRVVLPGYRFRSAIPLGISLGAALGVVVGVSADVLVAPGSRAATTGAMIGALVGASLACMACVLDRVAQRYAPEPIASASEPEVDGVWIGVRTVARRETALKVLENTRPLQITELPADDSIA